jgi:hypothetical protein
MPVMIRRSKRILLSFLGCIAILWITHTFATGSLIDSLAGSSTAWVTTITSTGATSTSVMIQFPIFTSNGERITSYSVSYVKGKSIAEADLSDIKEMSFAGDKVLINNDTGTLLLDNLSPGSTYDFVVTPINKEWTKLDTSDAKQFTTLTTDVGVWASVNGSGSDTVLWAADTASANFTYSLSGSKVTVKWTPIDGATKFMFSTKEATDSNYSSVGEELVSKGTYSFIIGKKWLYNVKAVPVDAGWNKSGIEKVLSVKIDAVSPVSGKGTPATGPALNLILMTTFLMMLIYVVYRFRTTK